MEAQVRAAQTAIEAVVRPRADDQLVLACRRFSVDIVGFEWVGIHRLRFRNGVDAADLELLDMLETEQIGEWFAEAVLVSGDGIFADTISRLAMTSGTEVTVVTRPDACSRRLRMAAKSVLHIDFDPSAFMEAA